jgi:hypothetical protein
VFKKTKPNGKIIDNFKSGICLILFQLMIHESISQNVSIGITTPQQKLHVAGAGQTIRVDGLSGAGTRNVYANAFGDLTTTPGTPADVWLTSGNAGLNSATNFLGTTDNVDLRFRTNNTERVTIKNTGAIGLFTNNPVTTWLHSIPTALANDWQFKWDNNLNGDAPARFQNTLAANGSRVFLGTTNYNGTAFAASAVMGLALNNTNTSPTLSGAEGVRGYSNSVSGIGVYAGFVGGNTPVIGWALYANGWAGGITPWVNISDERLKKNITTISNALDKVKRLRGVEYNYRSEEYPELHLSTAKQIGLIAQEVETVVPSAVIEKGFPLENDMMSPAMSAPRKSINLKSVAYTDLIPLLIEAIKEQQNEIEMLKSQVKQLQQSK